MSLEQAIQDHAASIRELAAAILKTASANVATTVTVTETKGGDAKQADAKKEPQKPAAEKAAASSAPGAKPQSAAKTDDAPTIDYSTVRTKILDLTKQAEGKDRCAALLSRFGVVKGPDLKPEQWPEFSAMIDRVLAGELDPRSAIDAEEEDEGMA